MFNPGHARVKQFENLMIWKFGKGTAIKSIHLYIPVLPCGPFQPAAHAFLQSHRTFYLYTFSKTEQFSFEFKVQYNIDTDDDARCIFVQ